MTSGELKLITPVALDDAGLVAVRNPARRDEIVGRVRRLRAGQVDAVVAAARLAQPGWAAVPVRERFAQVAQALKSVDVAGLDELLTREQGKVLSESTRELKYLSFPVTFLAEHLDWLEDGEDLGAAGPNRTVVYRDPVGVVGIISPWNVPVGTAVVNVAPALVAGNSVIVHVPVTAPLTLLRVFGEIATQLPPGVISLVTSDDTDVARALVEHGDVRHVHFTGSTSVGATVAHEAADGITELTLELGGNDAAIVLDDALADGAIYQRLVAGAFANGGQACVALKRLYVPEARVGEVLDGLAAILAGWVVGDGLDPGSTLGAMHTEAGRRRVERLLDRSRDEGGTVHSLGTMAGDPRQGYFVNPALVTGLDQSASLVREEQFGPVLPIVGYRTVEQAVAMANDSEYGLGGSVWSADVDEALRLARRLHAGMTWVNNHAGAAIDGRVPWGGVGRSGTGRGGSNRAGLESFTHAHAVSRQVAG